MNEVATPNASVPTRTPPDLSAVLRGGISDLVVQAQKEAAEFERKVFRALSDNYRLLEAVARRLEMTEEEMAATRR